MNAKESVTELRAEAPTADRPVFDAEFLRCSLFHCDGDIQPLPHALGDVVLGEDGEDTLLTGHDDVGRTTLSRVVSQKLTGERPSHHLYLQTMVKTTGRTLCDALD